MNFAICNETYQDWNFQATCEDIAEAGYDAVEIAPFTLENDPTQINDVRAYQLRMVAERAGLAITGFHWLLRKPAGLHLTSPDAQIRRGAKEMLHHLARICATMGGRVMVFGSPSQRDVLPGEQYSDAFERAVEIFRDVCDVAQPLGVTRALEPLSPKETNFMVTAEETLRVIRAVNHSGCQLHLDVNAMCAEQKSIEEIIVANKRHLVHFHANDSNMRGPGAGDVDFVPIFSALNMGGYDGTVSVEVFNYKPDPQTIARKSLDYLKHAFRQAVALVGNSE